VQTVEDQSMGRWFRIYICNDYAKASFSGIWRRNVPDKNNSGEHLSLWAWASEGGEGGPWQPWAL